MASRNIRVLLDNSDFALLTRLADQEKLPKVQILRRALRAYENVLRNHKALERNKLPRQPSAA